MTNGLRKYLTVLLVVAVCSLTAFAQGGSTGSISGTVMDQKGAVVPAADVVIKNMATNQEYSTKTSGDGTFSVQTLTAGVYTATITASGFKQAIVTEIKVDVGKPSSIGVELEVGSANETVTVVGGGELLQTQSATIGTTLTGRQITDLPTVSRDALDLVLALPGTTTVGRPRQSSVNGLPKGALNISLDGVNVQDNLLKSNDGFFTYIRPRTDAISEVTVSTTTPGSESSSEGAVQIKFVTQGGGNDYHGGVYWYHRNPALNANYWFSNRDSAPDPVTKKAPQARILLNQPGGKIGGPISIPGLFSGKDKAFFFVNYEEYRLPEKTFRTRTILTPQAQSGIFRFNLAANATPPANTTCVPAGTGQVCSVNVFTLAQNAGLQFTNTDPTIGSLLSEIRSSVSGLPLNPATDPNHQQVSFNNIGGQTRRFPTVRLDFNIMKKHHLENIWNYQEFGGLVDFLNGVDPAFPGFPNFGAQTSQRYSNVTAWRWTMTQNMVNEARFGLTGGTVLFFSEVSAAQFANQGGFNLGIGQAGITSATVTTAPSRRNSPVKQFSDTLSWVNGNHSWNFGGNYTRVNLWSQANTVVPTANFVPSSTLDPAGFNAFSSLSGVAGAQAGAASLYAVLSGRLSAINANARLDEKTLKYTYLGAQTNRAQVSEMGFYVQDSWRVRPNLTLSLGLRLERAVPIQSRNDTYANVTFESLFGESGVGNFSPNCANGVTCPPGAAAAGHSQYTAFPTGTKAYNQEFGTWLPSFGLVYSPNFRAGFLNRLMGESGQTVLRLGFSMASVREGTQVFQAVTGSNPGGLIATNRNITLGNLAPGTYLRQGPFAPPPFPDSLVFPNTGLLTDSVNAWLPDLKTGYVESWTVGIQRELDSNNVIEVRYVGNRGHRLWRQYDLNGLLNVRNNGVLQEFSLAQANVIANNLAGRFGCTVTVAPGGTCPTASRVPTFAYFGAGTNTSPLPITFGYLQNSALSNATNAALYTSSNWFATAFTGTLNPLNPSVLGFAGQLASTTFDSRRTPVGQACFGLTNCTGTGLFPYNMFLINPGKRGGAFIVDNGGQSYYDAVTVEFRRRLTRGLLVQSSYTFGKALSNTYASSSSVFDQPNDLFNPKIRKGVAPFNITHGFKTNFIYELPFGQGRTWLSGISGWTEKLVGGWGFNGNIRIQSGSPFTMGNVQLIGMTRKELQDAVGIRRDVDADGVNRGNVYIFPLDIRVNTWKANNIAFGLGGGTFTNGAPTGRFIAPAGFGNCKQTFPGDCGFTNLVLYGPAFFRSDLSIVKRVKFSERTNLELRGEFLNAFNNINFLVGSAGADVNTLTGLNATTFGRFTAAYQDLSTTNDPGGRLVQLVVRFNF
jgi:Carboxypeptidase regulatory-like domain